MNRGVFMADCNLYVMNTDICPKSDCVIEKHNCGSSCKYYAGFEICNGLPCIKCKYYYDNED